MIAALAPAPVRDTRDLEAVAGLFRAYQQVPELAGTSVRLEDGPGTIGAAYGPPDGELLLARRGDGTPGGCIALRRFDAASCEIKRLFVAPEARGLGLGRTLTEAAIAAARRLGFRQAKLDTMPTMTGAIALYRSLGFRPIPPFGVTPGDGLVYLGFDLMQDPTR